MAERRTLTEGLKATPKVDPSIAEEFVYGGKKGGASGANGASGDSGGGGGTVEAGAMASSGQAPTTSAVPTLTRVPISTRVREDFARALKRASLERQLDGVEPNTLQDILEEAIEPWLRSNKYFP